MEKNTNYSEKLRLEVGRISNFYFKVISEVGVKLISRQSNKMNKNIFLKYTTDNIDNILTVDGGRRYRL